MYAMYHQILQGNLMLLHSQNIYNTQNIIVIFQNSA